MNKTSIEWTDATWSPLRVRVREDAAQIAREKGYSSLVQIAEKMAGSIGPHCEHVSPGCENCYAGSNNHRCLPNNGTGLPYDRRSRDLVQSFVDEHILMKPLKARKPQKIFVENQSDLFGEWYSLSDLEKVWRVICGVLHKGHTFQILTKRPERMKELVPVLMNRVYGFHWRMPDNIWLGVSVENQEQADRRIPLLLQTPAAVRFASAEPLLGPIKIRRYVWLREGVQSDIPWLMGRLYAPPGLYEAHRNPHGAVAVKVENKLLGIKPDEMEPRDLDWWIVGGESGPGARPMHPDWVRNLCDQCQAAGVPFFFKQWGEFISEQCPGVEVRLNTLRPGQCVTSGIKGHYTLYTRVGKKAAGALLDGREWREFPQIFVTKENQ